MPGEEKVLILIPAYNEAECLPPLLEEVRQAMPGTPVLVVSDGSLDHTAAVARAEGARVLDLPCNLGVSGAVQAGFQYALMHGFDFVVRIDGDGQHPPEGIPTLLDAMREGRADLIVGSRFGVKDGITSTAMRRAGISVLARALSMICRAPVTDPTSGFMVLNRPLLYFFSKRYPADYPEPEALALLRRQGYTFAMVPVRFRERTAGTSSIDGWGTLYYVVKVMLALLVDRARNIDQRYSAKRVRKLMEST